MPETPRQKRAGEQQDTRFKKIIRRFFWHEPKEKRRARLTIWRWMPTARRIRKEFEND